MIRQVNASSGGNNQLMAIATTPRSRAVVPYLFRRISFSFAYPDYSNRETSMRCMLEGHHKTVTETISRPLITYYLDAGQYQLNVTALDENNQVLGTTAYYFIVRPPLYLSTAAYILYLLLVSLAGYFAWKSIKTHVRKQNEAIRLEQIKLQQEKLERREQKITALKNEKLEAELRHKSKELASSTMAIIRKNEMLLQIKQEVEIQKKKLGSQYPNKYADHLIRMINENISSDDDWEIFQQNFDVIHENFFRHIKSKYPGMTTHDMKLCAFIRLNLSTKEIASLLNITVRGIEAARYRLRKKFGITAEQNLTEFLIGLK
jgi:DNA-binding CsgD family transcriptional regulator